MEESSRESRSYASRLHQRILEIQIVKEKPIPLPIPIPQQPMIVATPSRSAYSTRNNKADVEKQSNLEKRIALQREKYKILEEKNKQLQAKLSQIEDVYEPKIQALMDEINSFQYKSASQFDSVLDELSIVRSKLQLVEHMTLEISSEL